MTTKRILNVYRGDPAIDATASFARVLAASGYTTDNLAIPDGLRARGVHKVFFARVRLSEYDAIVASEYMLVWALAVRLILTRERPALLAVGFNQSSRLVETKIGPVDRLLNRIWSRVSRFVVHSQDEARLFSARHQIPLNKITFAHWGFDLPTLDPQPFKSPFLGGFVSMVGRNNRDIKTFCDAVAQAGTSGIVVTSAYTLAENPIGDAPPNIVIFTDIPMSTCLSIVAGSDAHLILVRDGNRGAGHISAVAAMLLDKPQIFSDVATLADYLIEGHNGIAVPLRDPNACADALVQLRNNKALSDRIADNGRQFARQWLSNDASAARIAGIVLATMAGDEPPPDHWPAAQAAIADMIRRGEKGGADTQGRPST